MGFGAIELPSVIAVHLGQSGDPERKPAIIQIGS
jgi:hypothetical protein